MTFVTTCLSLSLAWSQAVSLPTTLPCVAPFVCASDVTGLFGTGRTRPSFVGLRDGAATSPTGVSSTLLLNRASESCIARVSGMSSSWYSEHKVFFSFSFYAFFNCRYCLCHYFTYLLLTYLLITYFDKMVYSILIQL